MTTARADKESAFLAKHPPRAEPKAEAPSYDRTAGDRYTAIRGMLAKHAPLSLEHYLAAQTAFLLMDLLSEQQATTAAQEETADLLREFIVHGKR